MDTIEASEIEKVGVDFENIKIYPLFVQGGINAHFHKAGITIRNAHGAEFTISINPDLKPDEDSELKVTKQGICLDRK
jgi:hypothetical protein